MVNETAKDQAFKELSAPRGADETESVYTICSPCVKFVNRIGIRKEKETLWFAILLGGPHSSSYKMTFLTEGFSYKMTMWEKFGR